jgi:hypothetical protein
MVKSKPVRKKYLDYLQNNCNLALRKIDKALKVKVFWDKLELSLSLELFNKEKNRIIFVLSRIS